MAVSLYFYRIACICTDHVIFYISSRKWKRVCYCHYFYTPRSEDPEG